MLINVDTPSGRTTGVSLRPSDTVADLKLRIEVEEWIPQGTIYSTWISLTNFACIDKQRLTYLNDKLEDERTFEFYGIGEGATIQLSQPDYVESDKAYYIYVQRTEEVFRVRIKASDTIGSLKTRLLNGKLTPPGEKIWQLVDNFQVIDSIMVHI